VLESSDCVGTKGVYSGIIDGIPETEAPRIHPPMKLICAWCRAEGRPGLLGEKPPLDDPAETHGICPRHRAELIESLPSASFPGVDLLIVVRPLEGSLFQYLDRRWSSVRGVQVIVDRRRAERRRGREPVSTERRRRPDARIRPPTFTPPGYQMIRFNRPQRLPGVAR